MTSRQKRFLHAAISIIIVALLVYYARTVHWGAAWRAVRSASPALLVLAALANLVTVLAKAVTWWLFLYPVGVRSFGLAARATIAGAGINNILIANSGDAARTVFVTRASGAPSSAVLAALALERLFDFIGYITLVICAAFLLPMPHDVERWRLEALFVLVGIVALFAVVLWRAPAEPRRAAGVMKVTAAPTALLARVRAYFVRFVGSLVHIINLPRLGAALLLTIVNWGAQIASYHLTARAAHFPITLAGTIATLITSNVGFLVRATPGNVGVFQLVYAVTAQAMGLSKDAAVGVAFLLQIAQNVPVIIIAAAVAPDLVLARHTPAADAGA